MIKGPEPEPDPAEVGRLLIDSGLDLEALQKLTGLHRAKLGRFRAGAKEATPEDAALIRSVLARKDSSPTR